MDWFSPVPIHEFTSPPKPLLWKVCTRPETPPGWFWIIAKTAAASGLLPATLLSAIFSRLSNKPIKTPFKQTERYRAEREGPESLNRFQTLMPHFCLAIILSLILL